MNAARKCECLSAMRKLPEATQQRGGLISPVHILFIVCSVNLFIPHILCTLFPYILGTIRYRKHLIFKFKAYNTFNCFFFIYRPTEPDLLPFLERADQTIRSFYVFYDLDIKESLYSFLQFSDTILSGFCRLFLQLTLQNILTEILLHLCQILEFTGIQAVRLMRSHL